MSNKPDGGPAFPRTAADPDWGGGTESFEGMSLRDYFAIHGDRPGKVEICRVLGWTCDDVNRFIPFSERPVGFKEVHFHELWATLSLEQQCEAYAAVRYAIADAMIAERSKGTDDE